MPDLTIHTWSLGGDQTALGWGICFAYIITSLSCFKKGRQLSESRASETFWYGLALLMLFLGINKQLDLQTIVGAFVRQAAMTDGWYAYRKHIQHVFIIALAVFLVFLLVFFRLLLAEAWHRFKLAWLGIFVLFSFIVLRAAAFNHQAKSLLESVGSYYLPLELLGVLVILIASCQKPHSRT